MSCADAFAILAPTVLTGLSLFRAVVTNLGRPRRVPSSLLPSLPRCAEVLTTRAESRSTRGCGFGCAERPALKGPSGGFLALGMVRGVSHYFGCVEMPTVTVWEGPVCEMPLVTVTVRTS